MLSRQGVVRKIAAVLIAFGAVAVWSDFDLKADIHGDGAQDHSYSQSFINIRTPNGKLYAYVVLLFNENPHFVNMIQEHSIPVEKMQKDGFHIAEYRNYLKNLRDPATYRIAEQLLNASRQPRKYNDKVLDSLRDALEKRNIILRFSRDRKGSDEERILLDYCIFGARKPLTINHPLFNTSERFYNIIPFIYYDEFSTSNSTFYFDMIYINPEEVQNDYIIARRILTGENVDSMFFVGARVGEDIKYCLARAFDNSKSIRAEIWKLFEIHELTHKILNNSYNYYDQVSGEELALSSTVFANAYLGLSVLYAYLDYNSTNPHRIAAMNYIRYVAAETGKKEITENPSLLKYLPVVELQRLSRLHFNSLLKHIR
ncbi:MAG TPA: hypothetical protein VLM75_04020 [Spirochaetota bacterium]|nr:hypothetical protein [Spirochaetota bacterium]